MTLPLPRIPQKRRSTPCNTKRKLENLPVPNAKRVKGKDTPKTPPLTVNIPVVPLTCEPSKQASSEDANKEVLASKSQKAVSNLGEELSNIMKFNDEDSEATEAHDSDATQPEESPEKQPETTKATKTESNPDKWACTACTVINEDMDATRCFVCGTGRNASFGAHETSDGGFHKPEIVTKSDPINAESSDQDVSVLDVKLSEDQQRAFDAVMAGKNVLITGEAGTGKSFLVDHLIDNLTHKKVHITASTGVAACNISGGTLHSFAGIGLGKGTKEDILYRVQSRKAAKTRWIECEILIVDEISMIDAELFEKLDYIARSIRSGQSYCEHLRQVPFGGLQLILVGDFLQLPPVTKGRNCRFAFQSTKWKQAIPETIQLRQIFRQKDNSFKRLLRQVRRGECPEDVYETLKSRLTGNDKVPPGQTQLLTHRADVDTMNRRRLNEIPQPSVEFFAADIQGRNHPDYKNFAKNCTGKEELEVKEGARVMLLKNIMTKAGLVNGALGTVVGFEPLDEMSFQSSGENHAQFFVNVGEKRLFPRVIFDCGIQATIGPHCWEYKKDGKVHIVRLQVPLMLAWAITIHKSQGMTLSSAYVSLNSCFANGQVYVALSRLQSLEGLHILGTTFNRRSIRAAEACLDFYGIPRNKAHQAPQSRSSFPPSRKSVPTSKFASVQGKFRKKLGKKSNAGTIPKFKTSLKPRFGSKSPASVGVKKKFGTSFRAQSEKKSTPSTKSEPAAFAKSKQIPAPVKSEPSAFAKPNQIPVSRRPSPSTFSNAFASKPSVSKKPSPLFGNTQKKANTMKFKRKSPPAMNAKTAEVIRLEKECEEWLEKLKKKCNGRPQKLKSIIGMLKMRHRDM